MNIAIITTENRRLYPAAVYHIDDIDHDNPLTDIDDIYDLLYRNHRILVLSTQYDQYGSELKFFNGQLEKSDVKAMFVENNEEPSKNLSSVMTLSEAAKKWGLSNGSTIRKSIERGKFQQHEIKQAGDVWITTYSAMERVFGPIKNEDDAYVIYDDFEDVYLTKLFYDYIQLYININSPIFHELNTEKLEEKYNYVREVFTKALNVIRKNQNVIIKKSRNNKVRQIISNESELFFYIEGFRIRKNMAPKIIDRLINDLKAISK